jgi:hypothetical protein
MSGPLAGVVVLVRCPLRHKPGGRAADRFQESVPAREPAGGLESGLVASLTGSVRIAIVSGGVACLVGAVAVTLALPALWRYDARAVPAPGPPLAGPVAAVPDVT